MATSNMNKIRLFLNILIIYSSLSVVYAQSEPTTSAPPPIRLDSRNYISSDNQLQALIERLERESQDSIKSNPLNYISDDTPFEDLILALQGNVNDNNVDATTAPITQQQQQSEAESNILEHLKSETIFSNGQPKLHEEPVCSICLDELSYGGKKSVKINKCGHGFHQDCLETWFRSVAGNRHRRTPDWRQCPFCRQDYLANDVNKSAR